MNISTHAPETIFTRLQMATALPPGPATDSILVELLTERLSIGSAPVPGLGVPVRTNLSAVGVRQLLQDPVDASMWLPAVLVGLRDQDAVRAVAEAAFVHGDQWLAWAVHLNPRAMRVPKSELPPVPAVTDITAMDRREFNVMTLASLESFVPLYGKLTLRPALHGMMFELVKHVDRLQARWTWGRAPLDVNYVPRQLRRAWKKAAPRPNLYNSPRARHKAVATGRGLEPTRARLATESPTPLDLEVLRLNLDSRAAAFTAADYGGVAYENPWLRHILMNTRKAWHHLLDPHVKAISGRILGEELTRELPGIDRTAWDTAVELLDAWPEKTLTDWVHSVKVRTEARRERESLAVSSEC